MTSMDLQKRKVLFDADLYEPFVHKKRFHPNNKHLCESVNAGVERRLVNWKIILELDFIG